MHISIQLVGDGTGLFDSWPNNLKRGPGLPDVTGARFRRTIQALDALSPSLTVTIDPAWMRDALRESVMAQVAEWITRVRELPNANVPELKDDAWRWWHAWALRFVPHHGPEEPLTLSDLYEIARRTVRPDNPARHRKYWIKSLRAKGADSELIRIAAASAGIGRSTVYARLRRGGKRKEDFLNEKNPERALAEFLRNEALTGRLSENRREIIHLLRESGMKEKSARKFERRTRHLPGKEELKRTRAALRRLENH